MSYLCESPFLKALRCENHSGTPPIWIMRQAGRYLPEYRALRRHYPMLTMFHQPEIVAQVTALPVNRFGLDAAILYSDILIILDMLGLYWNVKPGFGPFVEPAVTSVEQMRQLKVRPAAEVLSCTVKGIHLVKPMLNVPLIGFCGAPFTIACYLIEGKASRDFRAAKQWMYRDPETFHELLTLLSDAAIDFLNCQIDAGVDAIQIFDSWAYLLSPSCFKEFCLPYMRRIMNGLKRPDIPTILFCRGSSSFATDLAYVKPAAISLDWQCEIGAMRSQIPSSIALQGNLDPAILYSSRSTIAASVDRLLEQMGDDPGYIFNLGHGILPDTPVDSVEYLISLVRNRAEAFAST